MLAVVSASFKMKLLLSILLIATASLLTSSFTTYTYTRTYQVRTETVLPDSGNFSFREEPQSELLMQTEDKPPQEIDISSPPEPEPEPMGFPYFSQPGDGDILVHYDTRYFLGEPVSPSARRSTLHHMIRAYLTTMQQHNLETWIAHGTLLGWWWNGRSLPWDWDLDVQVSESTLYHMGQSMNMSTFAYQEVADPSQGIEVSIENGGKRTYLLDVNEHIYEREKGIGDNFIDARWIDTSNGLFVDITGISVTNPENGPNRWQCKNEHWYDGDEIWPLRDTVFEGVKVSIPGEFERVLEEEYGRPALQETKYNGYKWDGSVRGGEWVELSEEEKAADERESERIRIEEELRIADEEMARKFGGSKPFSHDGLDTMEAVQQAQEAGLLDPNQEIVGVEVVDDVVEESKSWLGSFLGLS